MSINAMRTAAGSSVTTGNGSRPVISTGSDRGSPLLSLRAPQASRSSGIPAHGPGGRRRDRSSSVISVRGNVELSECRVSSARLAHPDRGDAGENLAHCRRVERALPVEADESERTFKGDVCRALPDGVVYVDVELYVIVGNTDTTVFKPGEIDTGLQVQE